MWRGDALYPGRVFRGATPVGPPGASIQPAASEPANPIGSTVAGHRGQLGVVRRGACPGMAVPGAAVRAGARTWVSLHPCPQPGRPGGRAWNVQRGFGGVLAVRRAGVTLADLLPLPPIPR